MKYYVGLDIGSDSVGWAVTDEYFNVIKKQGKSLWGARLFDEADSQAARRAFRSSRRRLQRRKQRLALLQDIFTPEINKVDPVFFIRLQESSFKESDKSLVGKYSLFADKHLTDKEFFDKYPTIYHLRRHLLETDEKADIREIYLAFHHMIKYRGNFLQQGKQVSEDGVTLDSLKESFDALNNSIENINEDLSEEEDSVLSVLALTDKTIEEVYRCFKEVRGRRNVVDKLADIFDKKTNNLVLRLISGYSVKPGSLFNSEGYKDYDPLDFTSVKFETEVYPQIHSLYSDDEAELIETAKQINDAITIIRLLSGQKSLSSAMVNKYDKHHRQLREFKKYIKDNFDLRVYNHMFRELPKEKEANYAGYVGSTIINGQKQTCGHSTRDDFYKAIRKLLADKNDDYAKSVLELIDENDFLPLLNSTDNGVIPYQFNENEMRNILDKQSKYYSFINEKDADGYTGSEKILSLLTFKIPYYVGPLNLHVPSGKKTKGWMARKEDGKIYPWNFEAKVDIDKSAANFIENMKTNCSYLHGETTLPKNSLLYSEFLVLQEVNKLKINGDPITYEQKADIINNLFKTKKKVTIKAIESYLKSESGKDVEVTNTKDNTSVEIKSSLASYIDFHNIFKDSLEDNIEMVEKIIVDITLFEDKSILQRRLEKLYKLPPDKVKLIKGLTYTGYGKLSRKLLTGIKIEGFNENTGEVVELSIMDIMRTGNFNLMEIFQKYDFTDIIDKENGENEMTPAELVEESYLSPLMKRATDQSLKIINELQKEILKQPIDKFFVECTRNHSQDKKPKDSRREFILRQYQEAERLNNEYLNRLIKSNSALLVKKNKDGLDVITNDTLRSERVFLYFMQLGQSVYSGEPIDLEDVLQNNDCDVDHIIPQAILKDDSYTNKVLVKSSENRAKKDVYPISGNVLTSKGKSLCYSLYKMGLMPREKYDRIIRVAELSEDEIFRFVNRQLTSTNQSVAAVCDILKQTYCKDKPQNVVYSKAENVTDFRKEYGLLKSRTTNDVHHAQDAFLNVVVGECFNARYGFQGANIRKIYAAKKNGKRETLNTHKLFLSDIYDGDLLIWSVEKGRQTIADVKAQMYHKDALFTVMKHEQSGGLFDATIYSPDDPSKKNLIPIKYNMFVDGRKQSSPLADSKKYGGFSKPGVAYYMLVKSVDKKGKDHYSIEPVLKLLVSKMNDKAFIDKYLAEECGLKNPEVKIDKLLVNTVIQIGNSRVAITGKTNDSFLVKNVIELYFPQSLTNYVKVIDKVMDQLAKKGKGYDINKLIPDQDSYIVSGANKSLKTILVLSKRNNNILYKYLAMKMATFKEYENICISKFGKDFLTQDVVMKFRSLSLGNQIKLLREMLKMTKCDRTLSDYSLIGKSAQSGTVKIIKYISEKAIIVFQSVTGFFEKHIDPRKL